MARSLLYLLIAFGGSWALAFTYFESFGTEYSWRFAVMGALYMFVPALAACVVQRAYGEEIAKPLGVRFRINRWFFVAWLLPPLLAVAVTGVSALMPGGGVTPPPAPRPAVFFVAL